MILITGATGALGNNINIPNAIKVSREEMDITSYTQVKDVLKKYKPKKIIHLAGVSHGEFYAVNTNGTKNLLMTAQNYGLENFVFASTCGIYKQDSLEPTKETENVEPVGFYAHSKYLAEQHIKQLAECSYTIFRIFNVYGEGCPNSLVNKLVGGLTKVYAPDSYYRDYIHIDEACRIIELALNKKHKEVVNLASGIALSTSQLIGKIEEYGIKTQTAEVDGTGSISWADTTKLQRLFGKINQSIVLK